MGGKKVITIDGGAESGDRINSPRSLEACLRTGIEPDELLPKQPKDFWDRRGKYGLVEKEAATIRFQHFEQLRQHKLDAVRRERDRILVEYEGGLPSMAAATRHSPGKTKTGVASLSNGSKSPARSRSAGPLSRQNPNKGAAGSFSPDTAVDGFDDPLGDSTMVMLEERRLHRMKLRQQKEIQCVIEMETKMAKIQQENARRNADEVRKKLDYQKELRAKRAQLVAQKHQRELDKKKQEDLDAQQRKLRAKQEAAKEKTLQEQEQLKAQQRKQDAILKELERAQKADEFRRQTEQLLQQQEDLVARNRAKMLEKEQHVLLKMECATRQRQMEALERREKANARIHHATQQSQILLQKRKHEFDLRQCAASERSKEIQAQTMKELHERAQLTQKEEAIRQKRLEAARRQQEESVSRILTKRSVVDQKLEKVYQEREKKRLLATVEKELTLAEKQQTVERLKKVDEYNRRVMLQRIAEEDARSRRLKERKAQLMHARQQVALESLRRKHKINQAMEQLRRSNKWDAIEETLYAL